VRDVANSGILTSPPTARELNALLGGLRERGKVGTALALYERATSSSAESKEGATVVEGDAYTASILFGTLGDSVARREGARRDGGSERRGGGGSDESVANEGGARERPGSPCWQWNEAAAILDATGPRHMNNHAYAALLKVNERATETYDDSGRARHDGARCAVWVLERMKADRISPDVVTCSALLSTFDKARNWRASVTLLDAMRASSGVQKDAADGRTDVEDADVGRRWSLPAPNAYTYSLAMSTCARLRRGEEALSLLDRMAEDADAGRGVRPNAWACNAAIAACAGSSDGLATASKILEKMEDGPLARDATPDVVSYNALLALIDEDAFAGAKEELGGDRAMDLVVNVLDSMKARGIARDAVTYRNAITACKANCADALVLLRRALSDPDFIRTAESGKVDSPSLLKGRAASGLAFVANAALSVAAASGDTCGVSTILSLLSETGSRHLNSESIKHIIRTLGNVHDCEAILALLICLRGQEFANDVLKERYSIDVLSNISENFIPMIEEDVYSAAITSCLRHDELVAADQILLSMKKNGLVLDQRSLKSIIAEYCRMAMSESKEEFKIARLAMKRGEGDDDSRSSIVEPIYITSRARAKAALTMLKGVNKPCPPGLLSSVAKACCAAGLWQDARSILRRMHRSAVNELRRSSNGKLQDGRVGGKYLGELPRLHRSLLKFCAKGGNITPALNFADDIQFLASQIRQHAKSFRGSMAKVGTDQEQETVTLSSRLLMDIPTPDNIPEADFSNAGAISTLLERPVGQRTGSNRCHGLTGQDWKLILIAASRGGHWKICVGTLPFIRPYVKETHPKYARDSLLASSTCSDVSVSSYSRPSMERLNRKYQRIARALTAAVLCFEARSQYAWALRAIDDWIEWSGRRPQKEAVASACRVLAKRYRGQEVVNLVTKIMAITSVDVSVHENIPEEPSEYTYEKAIYTESINALHKSGLYEEKDQLYAEGVAGGHLPWAVTNKGTEKQLVLDLHGMSAPVAHSAVRVSLQKELLGSKQVSSNNTWTKEVMVITGRGRRSGERFRPVLRPEVQRMLTEEFYPPLGTSSVPGNMGALFVGREDIEAWLRHQRQRKGERLMFVADMLRDISSGNRLEKALMSSGNRLERALRSKLASEGADPIGNEGQTEDT
ncbi:hypothetical protein ACHAWF_009448, partial [Thalassiosira exigua]